RTGRNSTSRIALYARRGTRGGRSASIEVVPQPCGIARALQKEIRRASICENCAGARPRGKFRASTLPWCGCSGATSMSRLKSRAAREKVQASSRPWCGCTGATSMSRLKSRVRAISPTELEGDATLQHCGNGFAILERGFVGGLLDRVDRRLVEDATGR